MSICRKHPNALNDGDCIDCLRERLIEANEKIILRNRQILAMVGGLQALVAGVDSIFKEEQS